MKLLAALQPACGPTAHEHSPNPSPNMERMSVPFTFNASDWLWRYQLAGVPSSPLIDFKTQLPTALATDPRIWNREDVSVFLRWCEREFDLAPIDMDMFQMNGKAMCLLTRNDLSQRCPGAGDLVHNVLNHLIRDASILQRVLPSSPVTPTSRHTPYPLSPHSQPPTPKWNVFSQAEHFQNAAAATFTHFMAQGNSVTLSPAPSVDSQSSSPKHPDANQNATTVKSEWTFNGSNGSNNSDSEEDSSQESPTVAMPVTDSPPNTPNLLLAPIKSPKKEINASHLPQQFFRAGNNVTAAREFFPSDTPEPNTNGRLLWDFLQQLLNDPSQRYTSYIAWKNRETGVFKIVDPAGLAKLWGIQKNHLSMNYDKMSRALRYYYRVNILRKVQGERHCYQFLRNPTELKNIKNNISLLRQQMSSNQREFVKAEEASPPTPTLAPVPLHRTKNVMHHPTSPITKTPLMSHHHHHQQRSPTDHHTFQWKAPHADKLHMLDASNHMKLEQEAPPSPHMRMMMPPHRRLSSLSQSMDANCAINDDDEEMQPTDLSMVSHQATDLSRKSNDCNDDVFEANIKEECSI